MATDAGLCKYNGTDVTVYNAENSILTDDDILNLQKDICGRIWLFPFNRQRLFYIEDGEICRFDLPKDLKPYEVKVSQIFQIEPDTLWLSTDLEGIIKVTPDTVIRFENTASFNYSFPGVTYDENGQRIFVCTEAICVTTSADSLHMIYRVPASLHSQVMAIYNTKLSNGQVCIGTRSNVNYYEDRKLGRSLFSVKGRYQGFFINSKIYEDSRHNYWLPTMRGLVLLDTDSTDGIHHQVFFEGKSIYRFREDYEGNYWITTPDDGVYVVSAKAQNTVNYTEFDVDGKPVPIIDMVKYGDSTLLLATKGGGIIAMRGDERYELHLPHKHLIDTYSLVYDKASEGVWACCKSYTYFLGKQLLSGLPVLSNSNGSIDLTENTPGFREIRNGTDKSADGSPVGAEVKCVISDKVGNYYIGSSNSLCHVTSMDSIGSIFVPVDDKTYFNKRVAKQRPTAFAILNDSILLFGGLTSGVQQYVNGSISDDPVNAFLPGKKVVDIKVTDDNYVWIAEESSGIWLTKDGKVILNLNRNNGLLNNQVEELYIDQLGEVWAVTRNGINHIVYDKGQKKVARVDTFNMSNGILSNDINGIARLGNDLYLTSSKGMSVVHNFNDLRPPVIPKAYIGDIDTSGLATFDGTTFSTSYPENSFGVAFGGYIFGDRTDPVYRYRLTGRDDTEWTDIDYSNVQITGLQPGKYTFDVAVRNAAGLWSDPESVQLNIIPVFWQTLWFKGLIALVIIGLGFVAFRVRINQIQKREEQKTSINKQLAELKLKALHAQMNPHFIFNALNSIQHFVLSRDDEQASMYLMKFAKLMRLVLESSINDEIPLEDEIRSIGLYLDLEQLRMNNSFEFKIDVDMDADPYDLLIPTMVIQPYVENAVIHGLSDKASGGRLDISFCIVNQKLQCVITDNGPGINHVENKPRKHVSRAMQLVKEKMVIVNETRNEEVMVDTIDLHESGKQGTRVTITMPLKTSVAYA